MRTPVYAWAVIVTISLVAGMLKLWTMVRFERTRFSPTVMRWYGVLFGVVGAVAAALWVVAGVQALGG